MKICSDEEFQQFVGKISNLCIEGMVAADYCRFFNVDFDSSRKRLLDSYADFLACCTWLSGCLFESEATHHSPGTDRSLAKASSTLGRSVSHGALITAIPCLDLPYLIPGNSHGLSVEISRFCPHLNASN
jgi:hypothetical protein